MAELPKLEHNVFIKDEPHVDSPWLGLAAVPPTVSDERLYHDYLDQRSFQTHGFRTDVELSNLSSHQLNHIDNSLWQSPLVLHEQQELRSASIDDHFNSLAYTVAPDVIDLDAAVYTATPHLPTMNPRALDLSPRAIATPPTEPIIEIHTAVDTSSFETFSDWSQASADFGPLTAESLEEDQAPNVETPASSISEHSEYLADDGASGWLDLVAPEDINGPHGREHRKLLPRDTVRWRSTHGRVTSQASVSDPSASPLMQSHEAQHAAPRIPLQVSERTRKDEYLLSMRERGLSYKEIKRRGKYREAESTLRGRVRVLTKAKEERVRKPVWTRNDVKLLRTALHRHYDLEAFDCKSTNAKVPWKKIAQWLDDNGASYKFASATCARKWDEITKDS
ncbi:hypothetical protein AMS68_002350 [Peltaster fructicola]|uniref:Myb-like domain-containing protein n=1 Tax=Peltaster fructicola TaxID=286661 RepID=A0A6H0XQ50_9PEZI|nr:hypothetical protein AMS68_002350 [Peltaster fructicola]